MPTFSTCEDTKKFWSYIRSRKKYNVGIQNLKTGQKTITDDQSKADTLAEQFKTVSTKEDPALPVLPNSTFLDMPDIEITVEGVEKLLCTLKTDKSCWTRWYSKCSPQDSSSRVGHRPYSSSFNKVLKQVSYQKTGSVQISPRSSKRVPKLILQITGQFSPNLCFVVKLLEHIMGQPAYEVF